jgi:hypothetical protein
MKKLALLGIALQLTGCMVLGQKDESAELECPPYFVPRALSFLA